MAAVIRLSGGVAVGWLLVLGLVLISSRGELPGHVVYSETDGREPSVYAIIDPLTRRVTLTSMSTEMRPSPSWEFALDIDTFPLELRLWNVVRNNPDRVQSSFKFGYDGLPVDTDWSPDNRAVLILIRTEEGWMLYRVDTNGQGKRLYSDTIIVQAPASFDWNPDGSQIVYGTSDGIGISVIRLSDGSREQLYSTYSYPGGYVLAPQWSPGGERLLFLNPRPTETCLYVSRAAPDAAPRDIWCTPAGIEHAWWFPDGQHITAAAGRHLYRINAQDGTASEVGTWPVRVRGVDFDQQTGLLLGIDRNDRLLLYDTRSRLQVMLAENALFGWWYDGSS